MLSGRKINLFPLKEYERLLLAYLPLFASVTAFCAMLSLFLLLLFRFLLLLPFLHQISF